MKRIKSPDVAYLSATVEIPVPTTGDDLIETLTDGTVTVSLSSVAKRLRVPRDLAAWGTPPDVEPGPVRAVLLSRKARLRLRIVPAVSMVGVEVSHLVAAPRMAVVEFKNGSTSLGTIRRSVRGDGGARLFAAKDDTFTELVLSIEEQTFKSGPVFARFRYAI